ncbi:MAG TPA: serine/threonine-protein kinase, partial [Gemmata sp.]
MLKVLGKGGMGAVLLGRQLSLDRKVAIKVMHPKIAAHPSFVARFTREAYAAAQLTHHNVIQIYDIGEDHGQHFFSMEFVPGRSLMELVKAEGRLAADVAVGYTLQAARGLRYGHKQGMVHRDIKPDNLMLNTEGIVKVADLGLVKLPGGE